jgi:hypothetical protein
MKVYLIIISALIGLFLLCCLGLFLAGFIHTVQKQFKESKRDSNIKESKRHKDERKK